MPVPASCGWRIDTVSAARVNNLIQDLCRDPEGMARLRADPEACFDAYGLREEERVALRSGDPMRAVREAGAHPILAIHYLFAMNPEAMAQMSVRHYPELLAED